MKIAKGIKGIRKLINENRSGWHLFFRENENSEWQLGEYYSETVLQIRTNYHGWTLTDYSGNGLYFTKEM